MVSSLVALLDESDGGRRCIYQIGGGEPNHVDVFNDSPDDNAVSVDSFREGVARQRLLINLHHRDV